MKKFGLKPFLCLILAVIVGFGSVAASGLLSLAKEEPIMRIVMMADLHVEYGLQSLASPIRPSTAAAVTYVRKITNREGVDVVLVGGDMSGPRGDWKQEQIPVTQASVYDYMSDMTKDGKVMLVTGNHDPEPSVKVDSTAEDVYSGDYSSLMKKSCGEFVSALYVNDIDETLSPFNELLCYRYTVKGIEFLGLNTPYITNQASVCGFYAEQTKWLMAELEKIGKDKTVFLTCHYPSGSVKTITDPSTYSETNSCYQDLNKIFKDYPNLIYCYGHVHSGASYWAKTDTFEMVRIAATSTKVEDGVYNSPSYISTHMGSMGYYNNVYQPGGLTVNDPMVVQFMMVELYADRIVFRIHNVGEKIPPNGTEDVKPMTIVRDLSAQFGLDPAEGVYGGGEDPSDASSGFPWIWVLLALPVLAGGGAVAFFLYKKRQAEYYA
ncbi:MAG: metallophosphoesterase [Clostridia bacterium]|nr:metallophosphoesterase [Clostridia bacterium]